MDFKLAFDKNLKLELFVFKRIYYDKSKKIFFSSYRTEHMIDLIGSFLLIFLNTNFEDDEDCRAFVFWFCFESLYYRKHPKIRKMNRDSSSLLKLSFSEFNRELDEIVKENKDEFLYLKYTLLRNLRLPYDSSFFRQYDDELELSQKDIQNIIQEENNYYEDKSMRYNETEINGFMEKLNIKFETFGLLFENIDISKHNVPYYFESEDILAIIALIFKEFMSDNHNTIRQCQNCGYYFVPSNLKETKYCNVEYENTGKTCKQIGKELAYKRSLQEDKLLDKYRKRYMSLASSVSHYGTEKAIERFEKYKKDGAIIKKKYLSKEITPKEFENWIKSTKQ